MKKTSIAASIVIALGVVWIGSTWFTGKKLEENRDQMLQNANNWLNTELPQAHLTLSYQDYQRGLFSSHVKLIARSTSQTTDNGLLKPGQSLVFMENISHGPFPLTQLKRFNLIPGMASVHTELQNTDTVSRLFTLTKGKPFVTAESRIGYSGATRSAIHLQPVNYQNSQSGARLAFNGGDLTLSADNKGNKVDLSGVIDSLAITTKNRRDAPVLFTFTGLNLKSHTYPGTAEVRIGDQSLTLKKLNATVEGKEALSIEDISLATGLSNDDKNIAGRLDYRMNALKLQGQDFGSVSLILKLSQLDATALKTFSENYRTEMQPLVEQPDVDQQVLQQKAREVFARNLPVLLKGDPVITVAPLSWKNDKGESTFNLSAFLKAPSTSNSGANNNMQLLESVVKSLDARLVIPMDMASETMTRIGMAEGYPHDQAAKLAVQQVKGFAAMGQMFRLTSQQDNQIMTRLQYDNGQITINGEKMSLELFINRYTPGGMVSGNMPQ